MTLLVKDANGATQSIETLPATGQQTKAGSLPSTLATDDPAVLALGAPADSAWNGSAGSASSIAILKAIWSKLASLAQGIVLGAGENHIGQVGGTSAVAGGTFTRPSDTSAYAAGDLVANSTTAGSVVPITVSAARINNGTGLVRRMRLSKTGTSLTNAAFRVHLYRGSPTTSVGDNGAFAGATNGVATFYMGYFSVVMDEVFSDGAKGIAAPAIGTEIIFDTSGNSNVYALIEAAQAYTPISGEVFTIAAEILRD